MYSIHLSINQRRRHLPEIWNFFWKDRQTAIVVYRVVTLPKISDCVCFRAGTVWVNCYDNLNSQAPFGGYKVSNVWFCYSILCEFHFSCGDAIYAKCCETKKIISLFGNVYFFSRFKSMVNIIVVLDVWYRPWAWRVRAGGVHRGQDRHHRPHGEEQLDIQTREHVKKNVNVRT